MKSDEKIIAEAVRVEVSEQDDKIYLVFEIIDPQTKLDIKKNWVNDLEYKIVGKKLIL